MRDRQEILEDIADVAKRIADGHRWSYELLRDLVAELRQADANKA